VAVAVQILNGTDLHNNVSSGASGQLGSSVEHEPQTLLFSPFSMPDARLTVTDRVDVTLFRE
jgi:hypothetical protein